MASGRGYPLLFMDRYSKGVLYIWTIPDNFNDLYRLPPEVTSAIRNYVMAGFPARVDGPGQVALFAYDNNTFIVESYLPAAADVKVSVPDRFTKLRNLVTGETLAGQKPSQGRWGGRQGDIDQRISFNVHLLPHSYLVFAAEK
jgi:hypothetical protein